MRRSLAHIIRNHASIQVFELFDMLCLLSQGDLVYFGDAGQAANLFAAAGLPVPPMRNPADHFLHCINQARKQCRKLQCVLVWLRLPEPYGVLRACIGGQHEVKRSSPEVKWGETC
jgi:hypothetical protein